jgi:hypothetical protein
MRTGKRKRLWRPLNTYGLYFVAVVVFVVLAYTLVEL